MIQLTRLNNHVFSVNSDLIKFVEEAPDTVITLINGEKLIVRESAREVLERVLQFRRSVLDGLFLPAAQGTGNSESTSDLSTGTEPRED